MLVLPTWFTEARAVTKSPTYTGARNDSSSTKAVTTRLRAWRVAAAPAHSSPGLLGATDAVREPAAREDMLADKDGWWDLHRGAYVITYREKVNLPHDLMALARPRSTLLRSGVAIHAAVWDAGYSGRGEGLLSVLNARGWRIQRGARVLQLVFFRLSRPTLEGYKGRYLGENPA